MSKYSLNVTNLTPTATADAANLVDQTYVGVIQGGSATMRVIVSEVQLGGLAASSAPTNMVLARDSTVGVTATGGNHKSALLDGSATAPATLPVLGNGFTTKPQRSSTLQLLYLAFNAYGGALRWLAAPGEEIIVVGNTQPLGELSLSANSGGTTGALSAHIIYEVA